MKLLPANLDEIVDLRHRVLRAGLPRETANFEGDGAPTTRHLKAVDAGEIIGCATMVLNEWPGEPAWRVRAMAVEENWRGSGVGKALLNAIESAAGETRLLWCNARTPAIDFYRSAGWTIASEPFDIPTAGAHVKMFKRLPPLAR